MAKSLAALKAEAIQLGLEFADDVTAKALQTQIDAYLQPDELPEETEEEIAANVVSDVAPVKAEKPTKVEGASVVKTLGQKVAEAKAAASKERLIVVYDNDIKENSETTVAITTCANRYFDLGMAYVPLGEKVMLKQGFIDNLLETTYVHHMVKNGGQGSKAVIRKRYTVNFED